VGRATPTDLRNLLEWCVEAWDRNRWDTSLGAYREGIRGATLTAWDGSRSAPGVTYPGTLPIFQVAAATYVFIDIYLNFQDCVDPLTSETTKHRVRDNLKPIIQCTRRLVSGDINYNNGPSGLDKWGITYLMTEVAGQGWETNDGTVTKASGFVGGGALSNVSTDIGAAVGTWEVECTNASVPATFEVRRPDTTVEGTATTGTAYNGAINFTIAASGTAFSVGDQFNVLLQYQAENSVSPDLLSMFARAAAFCAHFFPSDTVQDLDGITLTYQQFYERCIDAEQLRNSISYDILYTWKTFGEYFGFMMDCDYFLASGVPAAPSSPRAPTDYDGQLWSNV
jgi:hypothetical protein